MKENPTVGSSFFGAFPSGLFSRRWRMSMHISVFTATITVNYTSEFWELFEATTYVVVVVVVVVVVYRVPAANAPGYTAACRLIVKPLVSDVPTCIARCLSHHSDARGGTIGREMAGNLTENSDLHATLGIFYMPQICDMGPTALLPLRRKACWGFFRPEKSDGFGRVLTRYQRPPRYF